MIFDKKYFVFVMSFYPYRKEGGLILLDDKRYRTGNLHYFFLKILAFK